MIRSTHYHIEYQGQRGRRTYKYQENARAQILATLGSVGTPGGFLPQVVPCHNPACLDPAPACQTVGSAKDGTCRDAWPSCTTDGRSSGAAIRSTIMTQHFD